ncbi:hypothetical protein BJX65DRAFT_147724 [Aspergillus insuetus]
MSTSVFLFSRTAHDLVVFFGHGYALVAPLLLLLDFRAFSQVHMSFYGLILLISLYTHTLQLLFLYSFSRIDNQQGELGNTSHHIIINIT